jgi:DNA polymerase-3 subunit gamma/tau
VSLCVFGTAESTKIIPTILSRCQIFDFKRIASKDAKEHLAELL